MSTTFNIEFYKLFDMLWKVYIPPQARVGHDGRFMDLYERTVASYDPSRGSARQYFRNSIVWSYSGRAKTYNNNACNRESYIRQVEDRLPDTYKFQDEFIRNRTLKSLIEKVSLFPQERRVLHLYLLNPKEPTMQEVASIMQISKSRVDQLANTVREKLAKEAERSENDNT